MKKFENRIVIVTRATRLEKVLEAQNTVSQAKFYINQLGGDFDEYQSEHSQYQESLKLIRKSLDSLGSIQLLNRAYLPNFIFAPDDVVVVIGQDGLVANTLKYLRGQSLIGVNPDPARWDGVLLPFAPRDAARITEETIAGKRKFAAVSMAKVQVQNGQELLAVNDFFIGQKTHVSARYVLKFGGLRENQSSSGIIVSTGLGSTGWMKSIIAGANRINNSVIGKPYGGAQEQDSLTEEDSVSEAEYREREAEYSLSSPAPIHMEIMEEDADMEGAAMINQAQDEKSPVHTMAKRLVPAGVKNRAKKSLGPSQLSSVVGKWSSRELLFAVREPFPSKTTGTNLIFGKITEAEPLRIESLMGENGVIFSDGMESDFIAFNSGTEAVITLSDEQGRIVV